MAEKRYGVKAEFDVEIPKGVDHNKAVDAVEELCDEFSAQLTRIGPSGFRSSYGPIVRTDAVLATYPLPILKRPVSREIEDEEDDIVPLPVIVQAIREFLKEPAAEITMYEPLNAVETGVWVADRHAGTWYLDGYNEDGSPNIEIGNLNSRCVEN